METCLLTSKTGFPYPRRLACLCPFGRIVPDQCPGAPGFATGPRETATGPSRTEQIAMIIALAVIIGLKRREGALGPG